MPTLDDDEGLVFPAPQRSRMSPARPLRFCHITTFYPPENFGGDGIFVERLVRELASRGHHIEVIHDADAFGLLHRGPVPAAPPSPPGVVVHTLRSRFGSLSPLLTQQFGVPGLKSPRIRAILDAGRFDVVHYHNISLVGGPGILSLGPRSAVKLYTTHEHWLVCPMHVLWRYDREVCPGKECLRCQLHGGRPPQLWRGTGLLARSLRDVDAFIAPSRDSLARHLAELDLPFAHIPHFLAPERSEERAPERAPATGRPAVANRIAAVEAPTPERPYFLFVGRLEKIKGLQDVIAAFRRYDGADLLVAGDGEYGETLRALAADIPRVRFLGRLPYEALRALYRGAIAAIVPSVCLEAFGMVVIEAFAEGAPAIVRRLGALPEVVEESGGGFVYATEEELIRAMETLRADPSLRRALGEKGRAAYRARWTPEAHLAQYFTLIGDLAEKKGAAEVAQAARASAEER